MTRLTVPRRLVSGAAAAAPAAVLAAVLAALLAACSAGPGPPDAPSPATAQARVGHALPDDPVRMLFPATGAETRWAQGLDAFGQQVAHATTASCAQRRGVRLPPSAPPAFIRFFELPDLDFIARHGFRQSAPVPMPASSPTATRSASPDVIRRCHAEGAAAAAALRAAYAPLQELWFRELTSLRRRPGTVGALRALFGCLAEHGVHARDEKGFFTLVDTRLNSAASADVRRTDRALGRAYASCMRPVEAVREPARLRLRARFLADHADDVRELRKTLVPSLRRAEERYGLRLSFPVP